MTGRAVRCWSRAVTVLVIASVLAIGSGVELSCYTCEGVLGGQDLDHCANPNSNTTTKLCSDNQVFCKKKLVRAAGVTTVQRQCYDAMCTDQQGIEMGQRVHIDTYCCVGVLCNAAPPGGGTAAPPPARLLAVALTVAAGVNYSLQPAA